MRGERETIGLAGLRSFNIATASGTSRAPLLGRLSFDCIFFCPPSSFTSIPLSIVGMLADCEPLATWQEARPLN